MKPRIVAQFVGAQVDHVVFDKTGTLTRGMLQLSETAVLDPLRIDAQRGLQIAAALESVGLEDGMVVSSHHHLRDGDLVAAAGMAYEIPTSDEHSCRRLLRAIDAMIDTMLASALGRMERAFESDEPLRPAFREALSEVAERTGRAARAASRMPASSARGDSATAA